MVLVSSLWSVERFGGLFGAAGMVRSFFFDRLNPGG